MRFTTLLLPAAIVATLTGCATRSYVDESIAASMATVESRQSSTDQQIAELSATARQALERATDAGKLAQGKFLYSVVLTDDGISFSSNGTTLSAANQQRLAALVQQLKSDNQNVYLEIQGHTDATGSESYNERLGLQRAENVRRYLHSQGVALDRMATISYGEAMPVAPNNTSEGRATNRRVSIVVLN